MRDAENHQPTTVGLRCGSDDKVQKRSINQIVRGCRNGRIVSRFQSRVFSLLLLMDLQVRLRRTSEEKLTEKMGLYGQTAFLSDQSD